MRYHVEYAENAMKALRKMDKHTSRLILAWVEKNIEGCENPRRHGKALQGNLCNSWRYRVGNYRLIAKIDDGRVIVLVLAVGHRSVIYKDVKF